MSEEKFFRSPIEISIINSGGFSSIGRRVRVSVKINYIKDNKWYSKETIIKCFETGDKHSAKQIFNSLVSDLDQQLLIFNYKKEIGLLENVFYHINDQGKQFEIEQIVNNLKHKIIITEPKPIIIRFDEKSGGKYFIAYSVQQAKNIYLHVLCERFKIGWYDDANDYETFRKSTEEQCCDLAYPLLSRRTDYEYEDFEVINPIEL